MNRNDDEMSSQDIDVSSPEMAYPEVSRTSSRRRMSLRARRRMSKSRVEDDLDDSCEADSDDFERMGLHTETASEDGDYGSSLPGRGNGGALANASSPSARSLAHGQAAEHSPPRRPSLSGNGMSRMSDRRSSGCSVSSKSSKRKFTNPFVLSMKHLAKVLNEDDRELVDVSCEGDGIDSISSQHILTDDDESDSSGQETSVDGRVKSKSSKSRNRSDTGDSSSYLQHVADDTDASTIGSPSSEKLLVQDGEERARPDPKMSASPPKHTSSFNSEDDARTPNTYRSVDSLSDSDASSLDEAPMEGVIPCVFTAKKGEGGQATSSYFDQSLSNNISPFMAHHFAVEHRLFLRAVLELLLERDQIGVQLHLDDPHTIKAGPLKKGTAFKGVWKSKYVEVRKGLLSYYDDAMMDGNESGSAVGRERSLGRKNIPLRAALCTCRAITAAKYSGSVSGYVFELTLHGEPKKLWMACTWEERQGWIRAIHEAMIGGTMWSRVAEGSAKGTYALPTNPALKGDDLDQYRHVQLMVKCSTCKDSYMDALSELWGTSLSVPVQWIKEQMEVSSWSDVPNNGGVVTPGCQEESSVSSGVDQLWRDMGRDAVSLNGYVVKGDSGHGAERILGALTRCILDFDKKHQATVADDNSRINEVQAISFARDILLAGNRGTSGGDSYYCVDTLCGNSDLAVLCPNAPHTEPLSITVATIDMPADQQSGAQLNKGEKCGWVTTRPSTRKPWKSRYCVLSGGILFYYEKEHPKPQGLREQLDVTGGTLVPSENNGRADDSSQQDTEKFVQQTYIICIVTRDRKERQLCFDDRNEYVEWRRALEYAFDSYVEDPYLTDDNVSTSSSRGKSRKRLGKSLLQTLRGNSDKDPDGGNGETKQSAQKSKLLGKSRGIPYADPVIDDPTYRPPAQGPVIPPSVSVCVQASTVYKVCTRAPVGDISKDTWAMIRTKFVQNFHLCGGNNGRLLSGKEIVQMGFLKGHLFREETFDLIFANDTT